MSSMKDFQIIEKIGDGAYSTVFKVMRSDDSCEYALKKVKLNNLSEKELKNSINEVRILASVHNKNVISYKEAFFDKNSKCLCIVMEYANNKDLYLKILDHQKKGSQFEENEIWLIFIQVIRGLRALHNLNILHRDLKSANVFLNKDFTVKLGDLNVSKVSQKGLGYTQTGTPYYASPEVWRDQPYDKKSDIWSLGCVLYEMVALKPPFRAEDMNSLYKKVIKGIYPEIPKTYSKELTHMIRSLLQVSPHLRPDCNQLCEKELILIKAKELNLEEDYSESNNILMQTIVIPKNMNKLDELLPKSNYGQISKSKGNKSARCNFQMEVIPEKEFEENVPNPPNIRDSNKNRIKNVIKRVIDKVNLDEEINQIIKVKNISRSVVKARYPSQEHKKSLENLLNKPNLPVRYLNYIKDRLKEKEGNMNNDDSKGKNYKNVYDKYMKNLVNLNNIDLSRNISVPQHNSINSINSIGISKVPLQGLPNINYKPKHMIIKYNNPKILKGIEKIRLSPTKILLEENIKLQKHLAMNKHLNIS